VARRKKPSEQVLSKLQELAAEAKILGPLNNPINKFFRSINTKYRKFRKLRQSESNWYNPDSALKKKIDSTELDILILTNLAVSYELLSSSDIYRNTSDSWLSALDRIKNKYVNQVIVDEAPDFSPLQLGCMKLLSHPQINSFFACGDFNQRITSTGTKNIDDFNSIIPGKPVTIREIKTPYRQCRKLYEFSLEVLKMIDGKTIEGHSARLTEMIDGFSPVLGENLKDAPLAVWIAERVTEIEKLLRAIPSIAILVPAEGYVKPVAQELQKALDEKTSAIVQPCHEGQARGNGKAIRVFDIKHIKGLEFEAAFFVALDRLERLYPPALLGNYLYVGATRAANFLGVSYEQTLPTVVDTTALRDCFVNTWRT
jgi:DNA helicase IV